MTKNVGEVEVRERDEEDLSTLAGSVLRCWKRDKRSEKRENRRNCGALNRDALVGLSFQEPLYCFGAS